MDARTTMIVAKGKPITFTVANYAYNRTSGKWDVTYKSGKTYSYNPHNINFLKDPVSLNPKSYRIWRNGEFLDNITAILAFKDSRTEYWRICFSTGYAHDYRRDELQIEQSVLDTVAAKQVFDYLRETADYVSVHTEDGTAILSKQYEKIEYMSEKSAAAVYLYPETYAAGTDLNASAPIFPFGCNESQFQAVCNALENRISVIEGPPGTGKTQTILNIIANLVIQGKSLQIVSNNNSAIDNIIEKLASPKYQMDFIVARLGSNAHKDAFVESQKGTYPDFSEWNSDEYGSPEFSASLQERSQELQEVFRDNNHLADLRKEQHDIQLELEHLCALVLEEPLIPFGKALSADKLMELWLEYQDIQDGTKKVTLLYRLHCWISYGIKLSILLRKEATAVINQLQYAYYKARLKEVEKEISATERKLKSINATAKMAEFTQISLNCFRSALANRYRSRESRPIFERDDLWKKPGRFLNEYPVVLSTTYTARSSLGRNATYDYVIMDEASQVDVATGVLALSSASNAVIVGDTKQLPNVVTDDQIKVLSAIRSKYSIAEEYTFEKYSFLSSLCALMGDRIPKAMLREHYRCHPQIIGFCNQKFYDGNLVVMTRGEGENALQLVTTVVGNHKRGRINQRQVDVIKKEILPNLHCPKSEIGIIAPYRDQVLQLRADLADLEIEVDTIHKFQGREKDAIILSCVDDIVTRFSDNPNLLNVAVSRAKKQFIIVASEAEQPIGSNVGDLIGYIRYNNCDIQHSQIRSVFDYLYCQYTEKRLEYLKKHKRISEYDSENLMYALIQDELQERQGMALGVVAHQPLQLLFRDTSKMSVEEQRFVLTGVSHVDFLVFNRVSKQPLLAIEVDGFQYHKNGTKQAERDKLKNHILEKYGLPLLRFSTNGSEEKQKLSAKLDELLNME